MDEPEQQVFAAPVEGVDGAPGDARRKPAGNRPAQAVVVHVHHRDAAADDQRQRSRGAWFRLRAVPAWEPRAGTERTGRAAGNRYAGLVDRRIYPKIAPPSRQEMTRSVASLPGDSRTTDDGPTSTLPPSWRRGARGVARRCAPCGGPDAHRGGRRAAGRRHAAQTGELSAELMYRLLVGDIALQRGDPALAARAYYEVAKEVRDARFARRATEIALAARQRTLALDAATLWSELDPAAERAKQVVAGLKGGGDVRGSDLKADLERALAEAAAAGPRLGEAFLELNRALASEPDKAATFKLVQALAQPYPNNAEAQFAVALAAYNTGLADFESATVALQAIDRALVQKPGWEQAILLKVEILGKQSMDRAADYLVEVLQVRAGREAAQFGAGAGAHPAEALRRRRGDSAEALGKGPGQSRVSVRHGDARDADEGLGEGRAAARGIESHRLWRRRRRRILSRAGRRGDRPLRARAGALPRRSGRRARLVREAARRGDARQARTRRRSAPLPGRAAGRHARAEDPGAAGHRAAPARRQQQQGGLRDSRRARSPSIPTSRTFSTTSRWSPRSSTGSMSSRRSSRGWSSSSLRMRTRSTRSATRSSTGRRASPRGSR